MQRLDPRRLLVLCLIAPGCAKAGPTTLPPAPATEVAGPAAPMLQGVYTEAQPSDDTLLHELYIVFDAQQIRVGHRMLGKPAQDTIPTAAALCEVFFDTAITWTSTGFVVAHGISAESQVGSVSVFLKTEDAASGSFSFDGSSCEVQLVPGAYKLEPTSELASDGRPRSFVLIPPAGAPQRFTAAGSTSFQDLGRALWDSLQKAPN